jgi:hypothetical protein
MKYEHAMMFHLTTQSDEIDRALAEARSLIGQPLVNVEIGKRRARIRDVGNCLVRVAQFEFEGPPALMETLRETLWTGHPALVSTLTIPHSPHERQSRFAPRRWEDAIDEMHRVSMEQPAFRVQEQNAAPEVPADKFSKEALMRRFESSDKPKRTFVRPVR